MGILGLQGSLNILIWKLQLRVASTYHGRYFFFMFRDCRQITFVTLNGFCPFNLKPKPPSPPPLYVMNNIKMDRIPQPKSNEKNIATNFTLYFKF